MRQNERIRAEILVQKHDQLDDWQPVLSLILVNKYCSLRNEQDRNERNIVLADMVKAHRQSLSYQHESKLIVINLF